MDQETGTWAAIGAVVGTFFTGLFAWFTQRSKGQVDESVAVRAQWERLTGSMADRLTQVEADLSRHRAESSEEVARLRREHSDEMAACARAHREEIDALRKHHRDTMDEMRAQHRDEMKAMRDLNEGLQRSIAQASKSQAQLLSDPERTAAVAELRRERGEDSRD